MNKKVRELLEQFLFERTQVAYTQMLEECPKLKDTVHEAVEIREEIENSTAMDERSKELVRRYIDAYMGADYDYQRYLYIQGAKDCAAALRELGVIK